MKTNENKPSRAAAGWNALRKIFRRRPIADDGVLEDVPNGPVTPPLSPLSRIQEYLLSHGLSKRVNVRHETAGEGFVLEDDDGLVHAKDYVAAVAMIKRIWLYQR